MASVISLEEAARRTGLTKRQIGDLVADPNSKVTIERDPVTGEKGIYPHTLRGVNGYQPPEPAPPPKPPPPPPPKPEPWIPGPAELAVLIKLDGHARAAAMADLKRQHPHLHAWFRDNPLPEAFRKPPPPPPPQAKPEPPPPPPPPKEPPIWQTSWQFDLDQSWQAPPKPPAPPPRPIPPKPPEPPPRPTPPAVPITPAAQESVGRLLVDVLWLAATGLVRNTWITIRQASRTWVRLTVSVLAIATFAGVYLVAQALLQRTHAPLGRRPFVPPHVSRPARHHGARSSIPHVKHPPVSVSPAYALPPLLPPGAGRQDPTRPR